MNDYDFRENYYTFAEYVIQGNDILTLFCANPNLFLLDNWMLEDKLMELFHYNRDVEVGLKANLTII